MKYDYNKDPCKCPKCKGIGFPWSGYFTCDDCGAIFHIGTGHEVEVYSWERGKGKVRKK